MDLTATEDNPSTISLTSVTDLAGDARTRRLLGETGRAIPGAEHLCWTRIGPFPQKLAATRHGERRVRLLVSLGWVAAGFLYELGVTLAWAEVRLRRLGGGEDRPDRPVGKLVLLQGLRRLLAHLMTETVLADEVRQYGSSPCVSRRCSAGRSRTEFRQDGRWVRVRVFLAGGSSRAWGRLRRHEARPAPGWDGRQG